MYSEIKDNEKILINRITDSDRIILENMVKTSKDASISIEALTGETGDFAGVMLHIIPNELLDFEVPVIIPKEIEINPNAIIDVLFEVIPDDVTILTKQYNYENLELETHNNIMTIETYNTGTFPIKYEVKKDGYNSIEGELIINSILRDKLDLGIYFGVDTATLTIKDTDDTELVPEMVTEVSAIYKIGAGVYTVTCSAEGYITSELPLEITESDLLFPTDELIIELEPEVTPEPEPEPEPPTENPEEII